jgi:hypothetical protein
MVKNCFDHWKIRILNLFRASKLGPRPQGGESGGPISSFEFVWGSTALVTVLSGLHFIRFVTGSSLSMLTQRRFG